MCCDMRCQLSFTLKKIEVMSSSWPYYYALNYTEKEVIRSVQNRAHAHKL